jgi:hypothetical protein
MLRAILTYCLLTGLLGAAFFAGYRMAPQGSISCKDDGTVLAENIHVDLRHMTTESSFKFRLSELCGESGIGRQI